MRRHAAHKEPVQSLSAVSSQNNKVGLFLSRHIQNDLRRLPFAKQSINLYAEFTGYHLFGLNADLLTVFEAVVKLCGGYPKFLGVEIDSVNKNYLASVTLDPVGSLNHRSLARL